MNQSNRAKWDYYSNFFPVRNLFLRLTFILDISSGLKLFGEQPHQSTMCLYWHRQPSFLFQFVRRRLVEIHFSHNGPLRRTVWKKDWMGREKVRYLSLILSNFCRYFLFRIFFFWLPVVGVGRAKCILVPKPYLFQRKSTIWLMSRVWVRDWTLGRLLSLSVPLNQIVIDTGSPIWKYKRDKTCLQRRLCNTKLPKMLSDYGIFKYEHKFLVPRLP